jgi:hypothetical protein
MLTLPKGYLTLISQFAPIFSRRVWRYAQVLLVGAILTPGKRTVTAALRIMGLSDERHFQRYHRVLNRAVWSGLEVSRTLLVILVKTFVPTGRLVFGIDETIERRWGAKIKARGIYRDPVRSSKSHFVKASGLRWISLMLLAPIPWAKKVWALPFLTVLAPSERYYEKCKRGHKKLTAWARQMLLQIRRWLPSRAMVVVADNSYAVIELLARLVRLSNPVYMVTRLRLDAALYEPAPPRKPGTRGRPRLKGDRLPALKQVLHDSKTEWTQETIHNWYGQGPRVVELASDTAIWYHSGKPPLPIRWVLIRDPQGKFEPRALLCTDLSATPWQIVTWFTCRWQVEVTFEEARAHLGMETQRQWSDLAIARTTPALLGLFSLVTLLADQQAKSNPLPVRKAAWYVKQWPTFSDALAAVRYQLWYPRDFHASLPDINVVKIPRSLFKRFIDTLCYAA